MKAGLPKKGRPALLIAGCTWKGAAALSGYPYGSITRFRSSTGVAMPACESMS